MDGSLQAYAYLFGTYITNGKTSASCIAVTVTAATRKIVACGHVDLDLEAYADG
jgi:hypothetical protein